MRELGPDGGFDAEAMSISYSLLQINPRDNDVGSGHVLGYERERTAPDFPPPYGRRHTPP